MFGSSVNSNHFQYGPQCFFKNGIQDTKAIQHTLFEGLAVLYGTLGNVGRNKNDRSTGIKGINAPSFLACFSIKSSKRSMVLFVTS
jgi:hypothetical protein